jgi:hypothetical protein
MSSAKARGPMKNPKPALDVLVFDNEWVALDNLTFLIE